MEIIDPTEDPRQARMVAILAHLWIPGWLIALVLNGQKKSLLGSYHIRQAIGWMLLSLILFWIIRFKAISFGIYVAGALYGIMNAMERERKPLPFLGVYFDQWFRNIF